MGNNYENFADNAKADSAQWDAEDYISFGSNYFTCGFRPDSKSISPYNHDIAVALALIGRLYGNADSTESDYKKGVSYIAKRLNITKRHVKVLRKRFKAHLRKRDGYAFKTPYDISQILSVIIDLLKESRQDDLMAIYLEKRIGALYRSVLIGEQYKAVEESANKKKSQKVGDVYARLRQITDVIE